MKYTIRLSLDFKRDAKPLLKRYPSLHKELAELGAELEINPRTGIALGGNVFKVRIAISSKGKGKSGGARVITYTITAKGEVWLLSIYDKSEQADIDKNELKRLVAEASQLSQQTPAPDTDTTTGKP